MSRLPHNISTIDLLASLESAEDTETTTWSNDVPHFLSHFKMEQGSYKVRVSLLYKLYCLYSKHPVPQAQFSTTAGQFIEYKHPYFKLNIQPIRIAKVVDTKTKETKVNFNANLAIKKHYEKFLEKCSVKKGKTWVEGQILHEIYRIYCIDNKLQSRMNQSNFITVSKLYFTCKRIGLSKTAWFNINDEIINRSLTSEDIIRVNKRRRVTSEDTKEKQRIAQTGSKRVKKASKKS